MNSIPSKPWAWAGVAVAALACLAVIAVASTPAVAAQQSGASEEEVVARVRAELEARLQQINQRLMERMQRIDEMSGLDKQELQRQLESMMLEESRLNEVLERYAGVAGELQSRYSEQAAQQTEEAMRRSEEAMRRAMAAVEQSMQRSRGLSRLRVDGSCEGFGETVLDHAEDLALSDDQVSRIREAQRATRRAAIARNADIEVGEMDLEALYEVDEPDLPAIRAKLEELAMLGVDNQMAGLDLRRQVNEILTAEQRAQLEALRGDQNFRVVISGVGSRVRVGRIGC